MSKKLFFVFNPFSGKAQIKNKLLKIVNTFTKNGWMVTMHPTQNTGDAFSVVREHAAAFDLLVISGGDGTLNESVRGLMTLPLSKRPPIGYIPSGTTNDFATTLRIPKTFDRAVENIISGQTFCCDVGSFNGKNFLYVAAFGAFTDVAYSTPQQSKNFWGQSAYILEGIKKLPALKPKHAKIQCDELTIEDDFIFGMISNTNSIGGFKAGKVFKAQLNDNLFEVVLVKNPKTLIERQEIITNLISQELTSDMFCVFKSNRITIAFDEKVQWTLDGEFGGDYSFVDVGVEHNAITFIID